MDQLEKNADKDFKDGQKALKTGLFKWTPDYVSAIIHFEDAAKNYRASKKFDKCMLTLLKCQEINVKLNEYWGAARNIETIVQLFLDQDLKFEKQQFEENAGLLFIQSDNPSNMVKLNGKCAKFLQTQNLYKEAVDLSQQALKEIETHQIQYGRQETFQYLIQLYIEQKQYEEAIQAYRNEITLNNDTHQNCLCIFLLYLIINENISAEDYLFNQTQKVDKFYTSNYFECGENLLDAYKNGDQQQFDKLTTRHPITSLFPLNRNQKSQSLVKNIKRII